MGDVAVGQDIGVKLKFADQIRDFLSASAKFPDVHRFMGCQRSRAES
jgi:hypothetical protein